MTIRRIILSLMICFSFIYAKAQLADTFEKGTITTIENVKIDGYIKTDDLSNLSSKVCFKLAETDAKYIKYDATQIKSFQTVTGKTFDLLAFRINNNSEQIEVFANLILKGEISLYKAVYKSTTFYIIVTRDENYVLQNDELISGETEIRKYNYQGVLNLATEGFSSKNYQKVPFDETSFIKVISGYNASKGYEAKEVTYDEKNIHYFIVNVGGGLKKDESELFFQAMYRLYYPKISRSTSLNLGLNYFNYQFSDLLANNTHIYVGDVKESLISVPLQFQQNILNKNIRPYIFMGLNLAYLKIVDDKGNSIIREGFQHNFGVGLLYGAGVEVDLYKGFMLKSEFRQELFTHLALFGIGYNFSK